MLQSPICIILYFTQLTQYFCKVLLILLAGVAVKVLFDTGATDCFVSQRFVRRVGLAMRPFLFVSEITYANGSSAPVVGVIRTELRLAGCLFNIMCICAFACCCLV